MPDRLADYAGPIHVLSNVLGQAHCVRLKDGRLHVIRRGAFPDLLTGYDHILASPALADVLRQSCGADLELPPALVIDLPTGQKLADYYDVRPHQEVTPVKLSRIDLSGSRAFHFQKSSLFVTKPVVVALQRAGLKSLEFELGFEGFCGEAAGGSL